MKKPAVILIISFFLLIQYTYSQNSDNKSIIGTWEMAIVDSEESKIDVGELIIYDDKLAKRVDSIQQIRLKKEKADPRLTKHYYKFDTESFYQYILGDGFGYKSRITNDIIFISGVPFYKILSLKEDSLKLEGINNNQILVLKRVKTSLEGLKIILDKTQH